MRLFAGRRLLAGLGATGAIALGAIPALPASAGLAAAPVEVNAYMSDLTVAAGHPGVVAAPYLSASAESEFQSAVGMFDFSAAQDVLEVVPWDENSGCVLTSPAVLECTEGLVVVGDTPSRSWFEVVFRALDGVRSGSGEVTFTFEADGVEPASVTFGVRVGDAVDLVGGPRVEMDVAPGASFTAPIAVINDSDVAVEGAAVVVNRNHKIKAGKKFTNCTYNGDTLRSCAFDTMLEPGATYTAQVPLVLAADAEAPGFSVNWFDWLTSAEFEDYSAFVVGHSMPLGEAGDAGELALVKTGSAEVARGAQADVDPENSTTYLEVTATGRNGVDLAAVGDRIEGAVGEVKTVTIGFRNDGPASADNTLGGSSITNWTITIPSGTTAVGVPDDCNPIKDDAEFGEPGADAYSCRDGSYLKVGDAFLFDFDLRIDSAEPSAGSVAINLPCNCDGGTNDIDPSNDVAVIGVNGGGGGGGGGLPVTGPAATAIAVGGGLLLTAGVVGMLAARRRRMRFVS